MRPADRRKQQRIRLRSRDAMEERRDDHFLDLAAFALGFLAGADF